MAWASENESGSRGFGFTGGHFHWNWGDPNFRKVVLNAVVWVAQGEVPKSGVEDPVVTLKQLEKNQDYNVPDNFKREAIRERLKLPGTKKAPGNPTSSVKICFPERGDHFEDSELLSQQGPRRGNRTAVLKKWRWDLTAIRCHHQTATVRQQKKTAPV